MKNKIGRAAAAAGSLALLGGAALAGAGPAGAAAFGNGAYGAATGGTIFTPPVANASVGEALSASNANVPGLLTTGPIFDRAAADGASSRITGGVVINLPHNGKLTLTGSSSWCRIFGSDAFGGVNLFGGSITYNLPSLITIPLPQKPAADTVIDLPYGDGTVTLNDQTDDVGEHGFAAVYVDLTDGQSVVLNVSGCYITPPV
jgi:hypothetical protein